MSDKVLCAYTHLPNDIHELVLKEASRAAVDEFITHMHGVYRGKGPTDPTLCILIDGSQSGMPPIGYILPRTGEMLAQYTNRPKARTAFILDNSLLLSVIDMFIRLQQRADKVRYFPSSQREAAVAWLLRGD